MSITFKNKLHGLLLIFLFVATCLLFTSMTSPLFTTHNWVDQHCFFTLGKGIVKGLIPYKDLFEQKGPILYFIHALGYLISPTNFYGVYLIQILFWIMNFYLIKNIYGLLLKNKRYLIILTILTIILFLTSDSYTRGDNAEEFSLTFILISLFLFIRYFYDKSPNYKSLFISGLCAGVIILIKFTLIGFHIALFSFVIMNLLLNKKFKQTLLSTLVILTSMLLPFIPVIIYFYLNDGLYDFFYTYFYSNIFFYTKDMSLLLRLIEILKGLWLNLFRNAIIVILSYIGLYKKVNKELGFFLIYSYVIFYLGLFIGGVFYIYYYFILVPYAIFGIVVLVNMYQMNIDNLLAKKKKLLLAFFCLYLLINSNCLPFYFSRLSITPQDQFAKIINGVEDSTLLNYGFLDGGFYLAANKMPTTKYFSKLNIDRNKYPLMYDTQDLIIKEKEVTFVVTRIDMKTGLSKVECPYLEDNYELVDTAYNYFDQYQYSLYQKKVN